MAKLTWVKAGTIAPQILLFHLPPKTYFDIGCEVYFVSEQLKRGEKKALCVKEMTIYEYVTVM